jgi:hypothetical protein
MIVFLNIIRAAIWEKVIKNQSGEKYSVDLLESID